MADVSSLATSSSTIRTISAHLALDVDFAARTLAGAATLQMRWREQDVSNCDTLRLDTRDLAVSKVRIKGGDSNEYQEARFILEPAVGDLGSALAISVPDPMRQSGGDLSVEVSYATSPQASGLQWLPKEQTDGQRHDYLFSQFQAIHARSAIPCQDSPGIKFRYTASLCVPKGLTALMSALSDGGPLEGKDQATSIFQFRQDVPMAAYLIAFVVADIVSAPIGPRSHVWTERENLDRCVYEFAETEQFLATTEALLTPYVWGKYDLLVLPGSFPYGGMENPCLTFVTPTLLAGDRSQADVVAHEIAHSWTGNLVTNSNWEHFWLNEGFTVWVERVVAARVAAASAGLTGAEADTFVKRARGFSHLMGWKDLTQDVQRFMHAGERELTPLLPTIGQRDPDDAFSSVPYERGSAFLFYLESELAGGDIEAFTHFLRAYIHRFSAIDHGLEPQAAMDATLTSEDFRKFTIQYWGAEGPGGTAKPNAVSALRKVNWAAWFKQAGMPPVDVRRYWDSSMAEACRSLGDRWRERALERASGRSVPPAEEVFNGAADMEGWSSDQKVTFLERLLDPVSEDGSDDSMVPWTKEDLRELDAQYHLAAEGSFEIRFRWHKLTIMARDEEAYPAVVAFATSQGRMKFTRPLFRALNGAGPVGRSVAVEAFEKSRHRFHNICAKMVARDLGLDGKQE